MPTFVARPESEVTPIGAIQLTGNARPESRLLFARSHGAQPPPGC
jgi:hypothetical protein